MQHIPNKLYILLVYNFVHVMEGVWVYEITLYEDTNKMNANTTYKDKRSNNVAVCLQKKNVKRV